MPPDIPPLSAFAQDLIANAVSRQRKLHDSIGESIARAKGAPHTDSDADNKHVVDDGETVSHRRLDSDDGPDPAKAREAMVRRQLDAWRGESAGNARTDGADAVVPLRLDADELDPEASRRRMVERQQEAWRK